MLSFINMGSRKKRQRKKNIRIIAGSRIGRRASRGSGSFMSPGDIGEVSEGSAARPFVSGEPNGRSAVTAKKGDTSSAPVQAQVAPKRSPEIQLEFKHDSLLQSLPEEFLRYRKGSAASSADDIDAARSPFSQVTDWTLNLEASSREKRSTQEKGRRMAPLPSVTPIKIPASPLQSEPGQPQQRGTRIRRSFTTNSPGWASDSEVSPVSGMSAARDVISKSFSFSARANGFGESSGKERETGQRMARQDSATLPRDFVWEGAIRSASVSRKSSAHSVKRRKHDTATADLPPIEAFILPSPRTRQGEADDKARAEAKGTEQQSAPPRKDSMWGHLRDGTAVKSPSPPCLTLSAHRLGHMDQAALHRISRITETDAEASATSLTPPASCSTSASFSSRLKKDLRPKPEGSALGSPFNMPSALSTPSTYSKYAGSPYASPGKRTAPVSAGANSGKSEYDYESFLEDFQFVALSSGPSSHGGKSGYTGSADSPYVAQIPMTAVSMSTMSESKSTSATGSSGFPQESLRFSPSRRMHSNAYTRAKRGKESSSPSYTSPSAKGESSTSLGHGSPYGRSQNGSISSTVVSAGKSAAISSKNREVPPKVVAAKNTIPKSKEDTNVTVSNTSTEDKMSHATLRVELSRPKTPDSEKRRPSLPQLHVVNPGLSPSSASTSTSPLSSRSPDLLDMLIPNGHIVTPISRHQIGRKRSGSTPSPIRITPQRSMRYLPMNGDDDDEIGAIEVREGGPENVPGMKNSPSTGDYAHTQTFPETPVLFSPDFAMDSVSRSNSVMSALKLPYSMSRSLLRSAIPLKSIAIPTTPLVTETTRAPAAPSEPNQNSLSDKESNSLLTAVAGSPPISPLQPPPSSPFIPVPAVQTVSDTARPSPPLLAPVPRRKTIHMRPPLPFGPRKPNTQLGKGTPPLSFAPRRAASEGAAGIARVIGNAKPQHKRPETPLSTPTFKTTPVAWRGLTLDAAKWTFSSAQLQATVRTAIEQSAQASSIRLLSQDVLEELPMTLSRLEARRLDIQKDYKVLVRRRRSIIQRLTSLSSGGPRTDTLSVVRDAEELANVTASCDRLAEELNDVGEQIVQICRLRDMHQASALAVALRKLNASLFRQSSETHTLQLEVTNLYAERNEAWRKAEELERELDALNEQAGPSRPKSVSSSQRSSRVSLARKGSSRTSKAGLRLSGYSYRRISNRSSGSSLLVNHATSVRTTFSSDVVPPVPPLPTLDSSILSSTSGSSSSRPPTSMPQSSALPGFSDGLYNDVYDLLGVKGPDRSMPSPFRPHSAVYYGSPPPSRDYNQRHNERTMDAKFSAAPHSESLTRLRSGSLPTSIPPQREAEEADAIIAMLDFRD